MHDSEIHAHDYLGYVHFKDARSEKYGAEIAVFGKLRSLLPVES